ncbi:MAG: hypothetical protein ACREAC_31020 [Blastocatellia bacterium]
MEHRLVIELGGDAHADSADYDAGPESWSNAALRSSAFSTMR